MAKARRVAILMNLNRPYDRQVIQGVTSYVQSRANWRLYVGEDPADKIPSFAAWSGDGFIVDLDDARIAEAIGRFEGKVVGIGCVPAAVQERLGISTVQTDDQMIGAWAAEHLLERGLRHFAYCGTRTRGLDVWEKVRRQALCARLADEGYCCSVFAGRRYAARHWALMQAELAGWLAELPKPVGLMACNDSRGRHVLEACRQLALRVPEDVAVIGVDNDELMCELAVPPLSSVAQGTQQIGYRAARLLDQLLTGRRRRPAQVTVPPASIVTRRSTDLVAIDDPVVARAVAFIRAHAAERMGVSDVVARTNVSRSTLEMRFKRHLGRTVHDEIQRVRLDLARGMLTGSDLPLQTVAARSGFRTAPYLSAVFTREFGKPPGQVRQEGRLGGTMRSVQKKT